jgi:hypothetical protein
VMIPLSNKAGQAGARQIFTCFRHDQFASAKRSKDCSKQVLDFEESVPGVELGRGVGIGVMWVPQGLAVENARGREKS